MFVYLCFRFGYLDCIIYGRTTHDGRERHSEYRSQNTAKGSAAAPTTIRNPKDHLLQRILAQRAATIDIYPPNSAFRIGFGLYTNIFTNNFKLYFIFTRYYHNSLISEFTMDNNVSSGDDDLRLSNALDIVQVIPTNLQITSTLISIKRFLLIYICVYYYKFIVFFRY